jgi:hypothetical protein
MPDTFPAVCHKYVVDFSAASGARFRVLLEFTSETSLTYTDLDANGNPIPDSRETVDITVEPIRDLLFLVTWQERDGTTVVHLEDYRMNTIITNITQPAKDAKGPGAHPDFLNFHGTMRQTA